MPKAKREDYNGYMREYMARRYLKRRTEIIERLGGRCSECGTTDDLHIDHIDHTKKTVNLNRRLAGIASWKLEEETRKCQLLCREHHEQKSLVEGSQQKNKGKDKKPLRHGTVNGYNAHKCRCDLCREAKRRSR